MNATPRPCFDFVKRAIPFTMSPDIEELVFALCGAGLSGQRVVWIVLHLVLKPRAEEMVPEGEEAAPQLEPENFKWQLWLDIYEWAQEQQPPITKDIMQQVFEGVCGGRILTLDEAKALIEQLSPRPNRAHGFG